MGKRLKRWKNIIRKNDRLYRKRGYTQLIGSLKKTFIPSFPELPSLTIDNKEYPVTLYLSAGDVFSVLDFISEGKKDYNSVVSKIVEKHKKLVFANKTLEI